VPIDGWRKLVPVNTGLVGTHTLVDDGPAGRVYEIVGTDQVNTYAAYGSPILLEPNTAQKFLIVQADANGAAGISREITLSVSYYRQTVTL
jgi:hypothetical protein